MIRRSKRPAPAFLLHALWLCACAAARPIPQGDGSYRLECTAGLASCANRAAAVCGDQGYYVVEGSEWPKVYGSPDGEQVAVDRSEIVFRCGNREREVVLPSTRPPPPPEPTPRARPAKPPSPAPKPERLCTPGATQSCVGSGRCSGGQACLPDGSGFGVCDCGPPAAPEETPEPGPVPKIESPY